MTLHHPFPQWGHSCAGSEAGDATRISPRQLLQLAGGFPAWQAERLPVSRSGQWAPWGLLLQELGPLQPVCAGAPEQEAFDLPGDTGLLHPGLRLGRA